MNKIDFENTTIQELREELINQGNKIFELQRKLNLANEELATYRKSIMKIAKNNLLGNADDISMDIEIPMNDFANIIEKNIENGLEDDKLMDKLYPTEIILSWNRLSTKFVWGAWIYNCGFIDVLREMYEEING